MTRSKLSDTEQQEVVRLFRESTATISELSRQHGVSSSTIRRMVKRHLSEAEYDRIVATKQTIGRKRNAAKPQSTSVELSSHIDMDVDVPTCTAESSSISPPSSKEKNVPQTEADQRERPLIGRRKRRRASAQSHAGSRQSVPSKDPTEVQADLSEINGDSSIVTASSSSQPEEFAKLIEEIEHDLEEDVQSIGEDGEDAADLEDFSEDSEDDFEEALEPEVTVEEILHLEPEAVIEVRPLLEASLSRPCYVVVDRSAELVTRPLKSFADLGQIPTEEEQSLTLPVFDNHRMARRFSQRSQRILKLPNGNLIKKACPQLYAKGITRLLINGQVYGL